MFPLVSMLTWLLQVLPAMSQQAHHINLTMTSVYFNHMLKWEPVPGTEAGVNYSVAIAQEIRGSWVPVVGCDHIQHPLVCDLTLALADKYQDYIIQVTPQLGAQTLKPTYKRFQPIRDTQLDPPRLTMLPCDRHLCVDLQPPREDLREIYESLQYKLLIQSNGVERSQDAKTLQRQVLENLAPGRKYCVSIAFSSSLVPRKSNYSQPVCDVAPGSSNREVVISSVLCSLLFVLLVAVAAMLVLVRYCWCVKRPLPRVLTSLHHMDSTQVLHISSETSLLKVEVTTPPAGKQPTLSEDSDEESGAGSGEGGYTLRAGCNRLSTSSSSHLSSPFPPSVTPGYSSHQTSEPIAPLSLVGGPTSAEMPAKLTLTPSETATKCLTEASIQKEEEKEVSVGSQDVNLLTLTFGMHKEEEEDKSHEEGSTSEDVPLNLLTKTWRTEEVEVEMEEESGYISRPSTQEL